MNDKMLHLMGIARRAGRLSLGSDAAVESMRKGRARLVVIAGDLSPRTAGGVELAAREEGVAAVRTKATMDEIGMALGKRAGVIAVNDAGFAKKLIALCADE
ncbi:MAG: 50S ribosomal protein L7ae [Clostridiales bacterium]|jgi:ribosomal protein L7Ae-like RNA K-turn-binding protein|nr:50S ribosomal protein L7ae [Clostridiales bacterium]